MEGRLELMPKADQESLARRFHHDNFDTELPPDVRAELKAPPQERPVILERPIYQPTNRSGIFKWGGGLALCAIILAGTIANYSGSPKAPGTPQQPDPVLKHSKAILAAQSTPIPTLGPAGSWRAPEQFAYNRNAAPRATLVKLPPPRARLVSLPPPVIGGRYLATMPYNVEVLATYRGEMASVNLLPSHGNQIGDMWVVEGTPWVWIFAPGTTHADWIDPVRKYSPSTICLQPYSN
jgi:hypothetical protein